ncbi:3'-5' exonuclease [soil metagenome]
MTDTRYKPRPTKEAIAELPPFQGLPLDRIELLKTAEQFVAAMIEIEKERYIGFDTESKPIFTKNVVQSGPHVVQFALRDRAYVVQVADTESHAFLKAVLESADIVKVGFGLKSDTSQLLHKLGIRLAGTVDLTQPLRTLGYKEALGAKVAVAVVLGQRLQKSRSVTTSNWEAPQLSPNQLIYAANDAYAALAIFHAFNARKQAPL